MKNIDLPSLHREIHTFVSERDWDQFHSVKNLACALSVEASELLELFQWMKEEDSNFSASDPSFRQKLEDEIADVFVYLLRIVSKTDIDLEAAVRAKMRKNELKYPIEKARGKAKKYDEL